MAQVLSFFFFIYGFFPIEQSLQHVGHRVRPPLQGLGASHSICWQGETIANHL
jgi:hypothetical protein